MWTFRGVVLPDGVTGELRSGTGASEVLPGHFALAGLVDAHCHLSVFADAQGPRLGDAALAADRLRTLARAGVTVVRDVGGERGVTLPLSMRLVEGTPRVIACGRFFAPAGRYFPRLHSPVAAEDLVAEVVREIEDGARWIKLIGDFPAVDADGPIRGSATEPTYALDVVAAVVEAAHQRSVRVAVHTNSSVVGALIRVGIDSVEHGSGLTVQDVVALGARGGAWTPTLGASVVAAPNESDARRARREARSRRYADLLPAAVSAGVTVLAGSDGVGTVAQEVALLTTVGLSVDQALRAAGTGAHEYLLGAPTDDIVTYDADPRQDPTVLATPSAVVIRGVRVA